MQIFQDLPIQMSKLENNKSDITLVYKGKWSFKLIDPSCVFVYRIRKKYESILNITVP